MFRFLAIFLMIGVAASAQTRLDSSAGPIEVSPIVSGLDEPWGFGFLPDGGILITERGGTLLLAKPGEAVREIGSNTGRLVDNEDVFDPHTGIPRMSGIPVGVRAQTRLS